MVRTFAALSLIAYLIGSLLTPAHAQISRGDRWTKIAVAPITLDSGLASIDLSSARGKYKALRVRVNRGTINFTQLQIIYLDGSVHQIDKEFRLRRRERTKPLDLRSEERFVEEINIGFEPSERGSAKATVEIWGLQSRKGRYAKRPKGESVADGGSEAGARRPYEGPPPLPPRLTGSETATDGDVLFGAEYVGFKSDKDVIRVGQKVGKFSKIRLRVRDNDIFIHDVKIVYSNGDPQTIKVEKEVLADFQTDWFELEGDRFIDSIHVTYKSRPDFEGQARVEVFGLHADGWLGPDGEGRQFNDGWVLLGAQPAGFIGFDRDVIPVGKNKGGFREIRVNVRERAITLNQLKVVYENGEEDIIPVRARVNAGSTFGPIALRTEGIEIEKIEARYRSRFIDKTARGKGNAVVEVWAKH